MHIIPYEKNNMTYYRVMGCIGTDPLTGKRVRITRSGLKSPEECKLLFYRLTLEYEAGEHQQRAEKYTFQEVYELWYEQYKNTVKESTLNKTLNIFKMHILPFYSKMYIDKIKVTHCQEAVNLWYGKLKNYKIVNNYCGLIFKHAMKLGITKDNPTMLVTMPVIKETVPGEESETENFYTLEELKTFLKVTKEHSDFKWYALFYTLAFTGCRKGELLALTWKDIDFKANTITVNKTVTLGLENKLIIQTPKTKTSKRVLPMDENTMGILKEWKSVQAREMLQIGFNTLNSSQVVFNNLKNTYMNPQKVGQKIDSICNHHGLKAITPHGFRHTHCSLLFEAGASMKEVQKRLGHSDIQTTMNIYAHVSPEKETETILKYAKYVKI